MTDEITHLQARVKVLEEALRRLLTPFGDDACRLDHHGYCQEHFIEEDCCVAFARVALAASIPADPVTNAGCRQQVTVKPLDLSNLLKHAFIAGRVSAGASSSFHGHAWSEYDPSKSAAYARILAALEPAPHVNETPKNEHISADVLAAIR